MTRLDDVASAIVEWLADYDHLRSKRPHNLDHLRSVIVGILELYIEENLND